MKYLETIQEYIHNNNSDISSHLDTIYMKVLEFKPKNIVELGVRSGESSKIFNYVNQEINSNIVGVDIDECDYSFMKNGTFYKANDIIFYAFYRSLYGNNIDVLFIDTSHYYEHTVQEINYWFPLLSHKALVIFHDTNLDLSYMRKNGTYGAAWNNQRGVIRAIEEFFGTQFNEKEEFHYSCEKDRISWKVSHEPFCNGLTLLYKN